MTEYYWDLQTFKGKHFENRRLATFDGETKSLIEWSKETNYKVCTLYDRIYRHKPLFPKPFEILFKKYRSLSMNKIRENND